MTRAAYFPAVILKSLSKRWGWLIGWALLIFVGLLMLAQPTLQAAGIAVLALLVMVLYVAYGSFQRHRDEYPPT